MMPKVWRVYVVIKRLVNFTRPFTHLNEGGCTHARSMEGGVFVKSCVQMQRRKYPKEVVCSPNPLQYFAPYCAK